MDQNTLFAKTPPGKLFLIAAIPGAIGMLASALYQVADGIFISRILGDTAFAGFNLAMPLVIINFALADLIGLGSAVPISIKLGSKDEQEANNYFTCASIMVVLAGILSGSGGNYENYIKPPLSPPGWLFPVVWAVLYLLMAIGMAMVWNADQAHAKPARNLYIVQLVVNLLWPFFFFRWEMWGFAAIWLLLLIALVMVMALRFEQISPKAAYLQIPYLIWLCFAAYLNIAIWLLNR